MIRLLVSLAVLTVIALGVASLADMPGDVVVTIAGMRFETSLAVGAACILVLGFGVALIWSFLRFIFRIPSLFALGFKARRRAKGHLAVSRGMIAVGSGDAKLARKSAADAVRFLGKESLPLLLSAQAAQMAGDQAGAERAFRDMTTDPATKLLGLRGLFVEAQRAGDEAGAFHHAEEAARFEPQAAWAGEALVNHYSQNGDWRSALEALTRTARALDRATVKRQRAVLLTADALQHADTAPSEALESAREAVKLAPDLVPAAVILARLLAQRNDLRKASKVIEAAWRIAPHPELSEAYLMIRSGDAARERLVRAEKLSRLAPDHPESRLVLAESLIGTRDFAKAREALEPLLASQPTVRTCLQMAELEECEHGDGGHVREWLARASRARRDPAWIADGVITDVWAPISPVSGRLDAFVWSQPTETLADRRISQVLDGALRSLRTSSGDAAPTIEETRQAESTPEAPSQQVSVPSSPARRQRLSTGLSLNSPSAALYTPKAAPQRHNVIFPLAQSPDDPGPDRSESDINPALSRPA